MCAHAHTHTHTHTHTPYAFSDFLSLSTSITMCPFDMGFPGVLVVKNPPANQETWVPSLGSGRSLGEGSGNPFRYSCLGNPKDREAWRATAPGVAKVFNMA